MVSVLAFSILVIVDWRNRGWSLAQAIPSISYPLLFILPVISGYSSIGADHPKVMGLIRRAASNPRINRVLKTPSNDLNDWQ